MPTPDFILELRRSIGHAHLFLVGITAVVLREHEGRRQLLLVRRVDTGEWTPVCGIVEPEEQVHEVAVREVLEETTVTAAIDRLVWVCSHPRFAYDNGDVCSYVNHTFLMHHVSGEPKPGDDESTDAGWFDLDDLPEMRREFTERIEVALADEPGCLMGELPGLRA